MPYIRNSYIYCQKPYKKEESVAITAQFEWNTSSLINETKLNVIFYVFILNAE